MKMITKILLGAVALIVILLIVALFTKKQYTVEREITINKPRQEVFSYIKFLKNQSHYSVWVMRDPEAYSQFKGTDGTAGFIYAWDGNKDVGKGEQEIKNISEGERIDYQLRFIKPFEGIADGYMATEALSENQTRVKWNFKSSMKYPMNLMLLFMDMNKIIGNDQQTGLNNLKSVLEN